MTTQEFLDEMAAGKRVVCGRNLAVAHRVLHAKLANPISASSRIELGKLA